MFQRNNRLWHKSLVCKSSSVVFNQVTTKPGDITIEFWEKAIQLHGTFHGSKITNWYIREKVCFDLFYCLCVGFWTLRVFATCVELPNWDKSDRIFKQIILITSKAEEKIQKLCFYYPGNFDENMRRPHERDPPKIRRVIKKYKWKSFELIAWQRGTWSRYLPPTKIKWNKIFLWANKRREAWKIFENHDKIFENHDTVQKQRKYGSPSIILSILQFKFNVMGFTLNFGAAISYQSLFSVVVFKIFPWLYASNNTPYVRIYYCTTSLRNHRLFLIPHFELWNLSSTLASSAAACCLAVSDLSYAWD